MKQKGFSSRARSYGQPLHRRNLVLYCLSGTLILVLIAAALVIALPSVLPSSDTPEKSDAILILGGNYDTRVPVAAELFHQGLAPKILLFREPPSSTRTAPNFTDVTIRMLRERGVPERDIVYFAPGVGVRSTADEARCLKLYASVYPVHSVLVVTSSFHCFRARMALRRAVSGEHLSVRVLGVETPNWSTSNWSKTAYGRSQVRLECLKTIYYFLFFHG